MEELINEEILENELYEFLDYNSYEEKLDKLFEKNKSSD